MRCLFAMVDLTLSTMISYNRRASFAYKSLEVQNEKHLMLHETLIRAVLQLSCTATASIASTPHPVEMAVD
jgi:hypothetical protein